MGQAGASFYTPMPSGTIADFGIHTQVDTDVSAMDLVVCSESSLVDPGQATS